MPIRPDLRSFYGREWREKTRPRILERAGYRCEQCAKPEHAIVYTYTWRAGEARMGQRVYHHMIWIAEGSKVWRNEAGSPCSPFAVRGLPAPIRVVLAVAHLNHEPGDDREENLAALCQWCHLHYDHLHNKDTRSRRKDAARPLLAACGEPALAAPRERERTP